MTSNDSPLEILFWRILNDRKIFSYRNACDCIVAHGEMADFRAWLSSDDLPKATQFLEKKMQSLPRDQKCNRARQFTRRLKIGLPKYRAHLARVCSHMNDFGVLQCQLPSMDQYGYVVEREPRPAVEQFFAYKIDKADKPWHREALRRLLEHLAWGYQVGISRQHLGFLVRKAESLKSLTEVGDED
jgi:hypothetical protein